MAFMRILKYGLILVVATGLSTTAFMATASAASTDTSVRNQLTMTVANLPESPNEVPWTKQGSYSEKATLKTLKAPGCTKYRATYKATERYSKSSPTFRNDDAKNGVKLAASRVSVFPTVKQAKAFMKTVLAHPMKKCVTSTSVGSLNASNLAVTSVDTTREVISNPKFGDGGVHFTVAADIGHLEDDTLTPDTVYLTDTYARKGRVVMEYTFLSEALSDDAGYFLGQRLDQLDQLTGK